MHREKEWGRSSLALLDVREESRRLSADLLQLDLALTGGGGGGGGAMATSRGWSTGSAGGGGGKRAGPRWGEGEGASAAEQLLREMEEKVFAALADVPLHLGYVYGAKGGFGSPGGGAKGGVGSPPPVAKLVRGFARRRFFCGSAVVASFSLFGFAGVGYRRGRVFPRKGLVCFKRYVEVTKCKIGLVVRSSAIVAHHRPGKYAQNVPDTRRNA